MSDCRLERQFDFNALHKIRQSAVTERKIFENSSNYDQQKADLFECLLCPAFRNAKYFFKSIKEIVCHH